MDTVFSYRTRLVQFDLDKAVKTEKVMKVSLEIDISFERS
jgi:hypothetical protein